MKVQIDQEKCIGCGACVASCSDVFEIGDDGKAHLKEEADCSKCDCRVAACGCPVDAITLLNS